MPEKVKFGVGDVTVISILWSYELVNYWLQSLSRYTSQVLFPNEELRLAHFQVNLTWIFFTSCSAILIVALLVEAFDHKYAVSLAGLCLCLSTPFIAVFTCITRFVPAAILMFWTASTIFVVSPATYSLIFNQNPDPVRRQVHYLVSFFEFIKSLFGKYLIFLCIPHTASGTEHELYLLIVVWVIVTPILVTLITLVERIKSHVTGDFINERGIKKILYGIHSDMKTQPPRRKGRSVIEVIFFVLLLLPALSLSTLDAALSNVNSDDDTNTQSPKLKHISFSVHIMAVPFTELVLSLTPTVKETTSEMVVLGMTHLINIAVVSILIFRMDHSLTRDFRGDRDAEGSYLDIELPHPGPGFLTFIIFTALDVRMKTAPPALFNDGVDTHELDTGKIFFSKYDIPLNKTSQTILFTITPLQSGSEDSPSVQRNITLSEKKHYVYYITGNSTNTRWGEVLGMENVTPKVAPQLMFLNSFTDEVIDGIPVVLADNTFRINSTEKGLDKQYPLPRAGAYSVIELPVGEVQVSYMYSGTDTRLVDILGSDFVRFTTEPFGVYLAFLIRTEKMRLNVVKTLGTPPVTITTTSPVTTTTTMTPPVTTTTTMTTTTSPLTTTTTPPMTRTTKKNLPKPIPKEPDVFQKSSHALLGATLGIASVGYDHFFWVESPFRMRAALYALFKVSINLVGWFTGKIMGDTLTRPKAIGLLSLEVVTTVWHLGLSWIFQARIRPH